jgi:hypothetical protein
MACSRADWVRGEARLISSAIISWQKTGPCTKRNWRRPALALVQHLGAENVGGHQVRGELHALFVQPQHPAQRGGELGLGEARGTHQKGMAAAQNGDQHLFHHLVLAEDLRRARSNNRETDDGQIHKC